MREIVRIFHRRAEEAPPGNIRLKADQFLILHYIVNCEDEVIQQDLAEWTGKDKSAVLRSIDSLEELGLMKRSCDPCDRRKNCLVLTENGHRIVEEYRMIMYELMKELFSDVSPEEVAVFFHVIRQVLAKAESLNS